jgi:hypothetical protein
MTDATAAAPIAAPAALPDAGESDAPGKSARQSVLDELLDADGPLTVQQIIDATGVDRNSVDQALHRLVEAGDALRAGRGLYVKAPPKPKAPPRPPLPPITLGRKARRRMDGDPGGVARRSFDLGRCDPWAAAG